MCSGLYSGLCLLLSYEWFEGKHKNRVKEEEFVLLLAFEGKVVDVSGSSCPQFHSGESQSESSIGLQRQWGVHMYQSGNPYFSTQQKKYSKVTTRLGIVI